MLLRNNIGLLRQCDACFSRFFRVSSLHKWHSRLKFWKPSYHVRWLMSDSSDSSSSSDSDTDELCVYQPDVRRVRIVTMNDVQSNDILHDAALSQSSVQRDTIYTRQHVDADNPTVQSLLQGICEGSRSALARAITLIESVHPKRQAEAQLLLREVLEFTRKKRQHSLHRVNSFRIGTVLIYMLWSRV